MSGRAGEFRAIKSTHRLADLGSKPGGAVFVLECGHARTGGAARNKSNGKRGLWCGICTKEAEATAKASPRADRRERGLSGAALERHIGRIVQERLDAALEQLTAPRAPPVNGHASLEARADAEEHGA